MKFTATHSELSPALKEWLDRVIVPALVNEYLVEQGTKSPLVVTESPVAHSAQPFARDNGGGW